MTQSLPCLGSMDTARRGYGKVAVEAAKLAVQRLPLPPLVAWETAAAREFTSESSRTKSCPKSTFLGLAEEGLIRGIPPGKYTRSTLNKRYALTAVELLKQNPQLANQPNVLWKQSVTNGPKKPNSQMEVVTALWASGLLA